jgi:hypothetical protein
VHWTALERRLLARQAAETIPADGMPRAAASGVPVLLAAMPKGQRAALRAAVWFVAAAALFLGGTAAALRKMAASRSWALRELATVTKLMAALLWEREAATREATGWGQGDPVQVSDSEGDSR